jgi:hypothetical protein
LREYTLAASATVNDSDSVSARQPSLERSIGSPPPSSPSLPPLLPSIAPPFFRRWLLGFLPMLPREKAATREKAEPTSEREGDNIDSGGHKKHY